MEVREGEGGWRITGKGPAHTAVKWSGERWMNTEETQIKRRSGKVGVHLKWSVLHPYGNALVSSSPLSLSVFSISLNPRCADQYSGRWSGCWERGGFRDVVRHIAWEQEYYYALIYKNVSKHTTDSTTFPLLTHCHNYIIHLFGRVWHISTSTMCISYIASKFNQCNFLCSWTKWR